MIRMGDLAQTATLFNGKVEIIDKFTKRGVKGIYVRVVDKNKNILHVEGPSNHQGLISVQFNLPVGTEPYYALAFPTTIENRLFLDDKDLEQIKPAVSGGEAVFEINIRRISAAPIWTAAGILFAGILGLYFWAKDK